MIETASVKVTQKVALAWVCDACGRREENREEAQEWLSWRHRGAYSSVFGDGEELSLDLCQGCVQAILGHAIRRHGNAYFPESGSHNPGKGLMPPLKILTPDGRNLVDERVFPAGMRDGFRPVLTKEEAAVPYLTEVPFETIEKPLDPYAFSAKPGARVLTTGRWA